MPSGPLLHTSTRAECPLPSYTGPAGRRCRGDGPGLRRGAGEEGWAAQSLASNAPSSVLESDSLFKSDPLCDTLQSHGVAHHRRPALHAGPSSGNRLRRRPESHSDTQVWTRSPWQHSECATKGSLVSSFDQMFRNFQWYF